MHDFIFPVSHHSYTKICISSKRKKQNEVSFRSLVLYKRNTGNKWLNTFQEVCAISKKKKHANMKLTYSYFNFYLKFLNKYDKSIYSPADLVLSTTQFLMFC